MRFAYYIKWEFVKMFANFGNTLQYNFIICNLFCYNLSKLVENLELFDTQKLEEILKHSTY